MSNTILITGASGYIGSHTARSLEGDPDLQLRLLSRTPREGWWQCDFADPSSLDAAFEGADVLFLVSITEREDREQLHRNAVDAAVRAGIRHIVYLSFFGAAPDATFAHARLHYATEQYIRASGVRFTFLRDNFYTEATRDFIVDGAIRGPAGDGAAAFVSRDDVVACAAAVLRQPEEHEQQVYSLTGPEALNMHEVARIASKHSGQTITYVDETLEQARASRAHYGAPDWEVDAWISTYTAIANGELAPASSDVAKLSGRQPMSVEAWWEENAGGATKRST